MNIDQIEQAQKNAEHLRKFHETNEKIKDFIEQLTEFKYLDLGTGYQKQLKIESHELFEMVGEGVIDLLKKKLWEREDYLEKLEAQDLITSHAKP